MTSQLGTSLIDSTGSAGSSGQTSWKLGQVFITQPIAACNSSGHTCLAISKSIYVPTISRTVDSKLNPALKPVLGGLVVAGGVAKILPCDLH